MQQLRAKTIQSHFHCCLEICMDIAQNHDKTKDKKILYFTLDFRQVETVKDIYRVLKGAATCGRGLDAFVEGHRVVEGQTEGGG